MHLRRAPGGTFSVFGFSKVQTGVYYWKSEKSDGVWGKFNFEIRFSTGPNLDGEMKRKVYLLMQNRECAWIREGWESGSFMSRGKSQGKVHEDWKASDLIETWFYFLNHITVEFYLSRFWTGIADSLLRGFCKLKKIKNIRHNSLKSWRK